ncbi:hypothetical protein [Microbacterium sp.]|uniref:hypothetical protein n=1 Tax=Microbacterium sp. TaxID=51671 RepID=UPI003F80DCAB
MVAMAGIAFVCADFVATCREHRLGGTLTQRRRTVKRRDGLAVVAESDLAARVRSVQ